MFAIEPAGQGCRPGRMSHSAEALLSVPSGLRPSLQAGSLQAPGCRDCPPVDPDGASTELRPVDSLSSRGAVTGLLLRPDHSMPGSPLSPILPANEEETAAQYPPGVR